jgi:hypothetical protein
MAFVLATPADLVEILKGLGAEQRVPTLTSGTRDAFTIGVPGPGTYLVWRIEEGNG